MDLKTAYEKVLLKKLSVGKTCPKCGKIIDDCGYFSEPDHKGIIGCFTHGTRIVTSMFGSSIVPDKRCYVTKEEFEEVLNR